MSIVRYIGVLKTIPGHKQKKSHIVAATLSTHDIRERLMKGWNRGRSIWRVMEQENQQQPHMEDTFNNKSITLSSKLS
jgi:hypothetical protein